MTREERMQEEWLKTNEPTKTEDTKPYYKENHLPRHKQNRDNSYLLDRYPVDVDPLIGRSIHLSSAIFPEATVVCARGTSQYYCSDDKVRTRKDIESRLVEPTNPKE